MRVAFPCFLVSGGGAWVSRLRAWCPRVLGGGSVWGGAGVAPASSGRVSSWGLGLASRAGAGGADADADQGTAALVAALGFAGFFTLGLMVGFVLFGLLLWSGFFLVLAALLLLLLVPLRSFAALMTMMMVVALALALLVLVLLALTILTFLLVALAAGAGA